VKLGGTITARLEIVWRNPVPVRRPQWRRTVKQADGHNVYALQEELVGNGILGFWTPTCDLEVHRGGRAA
jgi:hypothetical protein